MLKGIEVENFAIIDNLKLQFHKGLNVFTGETGAGKTIIIEALSAALGEKTGQEVVRTGEEKARVAALFDITDVEGITGIKGEELLFQREVGPGKSACSLNGRMAPVSSVREAGNALVDIHGQHEHQAILNTSRHIDLLDRFGGLYGEQKEVAKKYIELKQKEKRLEELTGLEKTEESVRELLQFQVEEIKRAKLSEVEEPEIEKERLLLANAQKLNEALSLAYQGLYEEEGAVAERVRKISAQLEALGSIDAELSEIARMLEEARVSISDIASRIRVRRDGIQYDPGKLEELTERLDFIGKLKRKYGPAVADVLKFGAETEKKLKEISSHKEEIEKLGGEIVKLENEALKQAKELSRKRKTAAARLEKKMVEELAGLEMKKTQFRVDIKPRKPSAQFTSLQVYKFTSEELGPKGIDDVEFLISPNPGEDLRPLSKIASGGETSRIMLALKSILADADEIPVLVFDEIDIGIGGKTASSVGEKLRKLAGKKQILCVTHLPQIAAFADVHFKVEKVVEKGRTKTSVRKLDDNEKVEEIARMISGEKITSTSLKHAQELLRK